MVIGPPLAGTDWLAGNGCCSYNNHRNVMLPIGGRINGSERFAVDWFRWDPVDDLARLATGVLPTFRGELTNNEDYLAYAEPVLAVADGTVVAVVSDVPDQPAARPSERHRPRRPRRQPRRARHRWRHLRLVLPPGARVVLGGRR